MTAPADELSAALDRHLVEYPRATAAARRLIELAPMFRRAVSDMVRAYGTTFFRRGEQRIHEIDHLSGDDPQRFDEALKAYVRFCMEFARKQAEFIKTGQYSFQDFDEMCEALYGNDDAVRDFYLYALLLSFVFSPNYYEFYDFFEQDFLPNVPTGTPVVEVGCGHGVYLARTLLGRDGTTGIGVDIAPAALEVARRILGFYRIDDDRTKLVVDDVRGTLDLADASAGAIICCEVLEHLPDPRHALGELRRILAPGGVAMLSAAIRMESVDHLYVFRTHQEVAEMVADAGFGVQAQRVVPLAKGNIMDQAERARLAEDPRVPVGYICRAVPN